MASAIKLIVGLGNPGPEHLMTRHNAGFWFADSLAREHSLVFKPESRFKAETARLTLAGHDCLLSKPQTYMNNSGQSVQAIMAFYKVPLSDLLVVHDEIDLDAGVIRFKQGGGHGGNNGIRDIIEKLGEQDFNRLRIGVGHPGVSHEVTNHVLGKPSAEDADRIMGCIGAGIALLPQILDSEYHKVMTALHTRSPEE